MKPAAYRIFRNNRWNYGDAPSIRKEERAAWQPLYSDIDVQEMKARIRAEQKEACAKRLEDDGWSYGAALIRAMATDAPHSS
jgi:hypothetical protein